jgi:hypothetical protein
MHEPKFHNNTPFAAAILPYLDNAGRDSRLVLIKGSYDLGTSAPHKLLDEQRPIRMGDEPWGDPKASDNKYPSDLCAFKPGTDFLVKGHAMGPAGRPASYFDVTISCAGRTVRLRAHGPRRWQLSPIGQMTISDAAPVLRVPLCWALAYGGKDFSDPKKPVECPENPAGRGIARNELDLHHRPAPQIEDPHHPIRSPNQGARPIGVGPLGPIFQPRRALAGTYDAHWLDRVHPAKPDDYQPAFENVAPRDFVFETPFRGREIGGIHGMTTEAPLAFQIPLERPYVEWTIDGALERKEPHLDTVLVDTDDKVLELVWRVCIPCPSKMRNRFTEVNAYRKEVLTR